VKEEEVNPPCLKDLESIFEREHNKRRKKRRKPRRPTGIRRSGSGSVDGVWRCVEVSRCGAVEVVPEKEAPP